MTTAVGAVRSHGRSEVSGGVDRDVFVLEAIVQELPDLKGTPTVVCVCQVVERLYFSPGSASNDSMHPAVMQKVWTA